MKILLQIKHWKFFFLLLLFHVVLIILSLFKDQSGIKEISIALGMLYVIFLFYWFLVLGLYLNAIPENPFKFKNRVLVFAVLCEILGYMELIFANIFTNFKMLTYLIPFCAFGIIYTFYVVPKSLNSIELGREANFKDYLIDIALLFAYPVGVWFLQPRINTE